MENTFTVTYPRKEELQAARLKALNDKDTKKY
jgi:hypothetical protein